MIKNISSMFIYDKEFYLESKNYDKGKPFPQNNYPGAI